MRELTCAGALLVLLSGPVWAHDMDGPIAGEADIEHPGMAATIMNWLLAPADAAATITSDGTTLTVKGDGYPDRAPGQFPNSGNPNSIVKKNYTIRLPAKPSVTGPTPVGRGDVFGISVDGVLMDGLTAEYWNNDRSSGWNYYAFWPGCRLGLDHNNAHVQPDGTYHYHGVPEGIVEDATGGPVLVGYAADGFPVYGPMGYADAGAAAGSLKQLKSSYRLKSGNRPSGPRGRYTGAFMEDFVYVEGAGDLDQCNGRVAATAQHPEGIYQYVITEEFPNIPLCWMGSPSPSLARIKGGPGPGGPGRGPPPGAGGPPPGAGGPPPRPGGRGPCSGS